MQEESIKILQRSSFQGIFSWKWKYAYFCNIHSLTSHFISGFIGTGYLLFGRNYLVIFILVNIFYAFSIFYSIFRIYFFVAFCCIQSVVFSTDLPTLIFVSFSTSWHQFIVFLHQPLLSFCSFILVKVVCYFLEI